MNCGEDKDQKKSQELFSRANTVPEFLALWAKFYSNEICTPGYLDNFIGGEDNPQADDKIGAKFQTITSYGVIAHDFQTNSLEDGQKAYVTAFVPNELAGQIATYINRYPGYIALYRDIEDKFNIKGVYTTYDPEDENVKELSKRTGVLFGTPYTSLDYAGGEEFDSIREWLNKKLKKIINQKNYKIITIIDTMPREAPDRILDMIIYALTDKK